MTVKLTLSIDENVVKKAKRLSKQRGVSISKFVESYIVALNEKEEESLVEKIRNCMEPHLQKLNIPSDANYKQLIRQWKHEDYLNESAERLKNNGRKKS